MVKILISKFSYRTSTIDAECRCEGGFFYDISTLRARRAARDMDPATRRMEANSCQRFGSMALGLAFTCATIENAAQVKCWGLNEYGVLGPAVPLGQNTLDINIASLPVLDLGTNVVVEELSTGQGAKHACARLSTGQVKCWGRNSYGNLGQGDTVHRGSLPSQMGDNLLPVNLGTNRIALQIASGENYNCALLDNLKVKCWGRNAKGQLGIGSTVDKGDQPGEMGDNLPYVSLPGPVTGVRAGYQHTAVRLENGQLCLWGLGNYAQEGGPFPDQTQGYRTTPLCLPQYGYIAMDFAVTRDHTCAILSTTASNPSSRLHCWGGAGLNQWGFGGYILLAQTGTGWNWNSNPEIGMTDKLALGQWSTCRMNSLMDSLLCTGASVSGQHGNSTLQDPMELGSGSFVKDVACGQFHCCGRLDKQQLKCWGNNAEGQLGFRTAKASIGTVASDMGENLPVVKFNDCDSLKCGANSVW